MEHEPANKTLPVAAISALHRGNKIEAIKLVREQRGIGLKEAKDVVDEYVRTQPSLHATFAAARAQSGRSALLWLAIVIGVAVLLYVFFTK